MHPNLLLYVIEFKDYVDLLLDNNKSQQTNKLLEYQVQTLKLLKSGDQWIFQC